MADIDEAIKAAQAAAANIVDAEVVSETLPATTAGYQPPVNYAKPSMETHGQATGISSKVDTWLKVDEFGLNVGTDRKKVEEVLVEIDMTEEVGFFVKESIKWGSTPVNYASRFGGAMADNGQPWAEVVARAVRLDPRAKVYPSADIIARVADPIEQSKGVDPVAVGTMMGIGLSMSNWGNWVTFYQDVAKAGLLGTTVKVKVLAEEVKGKKNGMTWGVMKFELVA